MRPTRTARSLATLIALPLAGLVACAAPGDPPPRIVDGGIGGSCDEKAAAAFVGQPISDDVAARARDAAGARGVRIIRPGMAVTMDYRAGRLNLHLDDADRITRVSCG